MREPVKKKAAVKPSSTAPAASAAFDLEAYLSTADAARRSVKYRAGATVFEQGGGSDAVMFLKSGAVKISVLSKIGKEAVIAILAPGDFFGEGALTGQLIRIATATALIASDVQVIELDAMTKLLRAEPAFADRFLHFMLSRNLRIEADLVDQLFNSSEKRLARTLLLLARYGEPEQTDYVLPMISQETLAEMIGATRTRVNFFMNKFRRLGFIEYNGRLKVNSSLLTVVLHD
jgi:CRP-like cAMP-binding protein